MYICSQTHFHFCVKVAKHPQSCPLPSLISLSLSLLSLLSLHIVLFPSWPPSLFLSDCLSTPRWWYTILTQPMERPKTSIHSPSPYHIPSHGIGHLLLMLHLQLRDPSCILPLSSSHLPSSLPHASPSSLPLRCITPLTLAVYTPLLGSPITWKGKVGLGIGGRAFLYCPFY